ncbi:hypothetical protein Tco_1182164 [Tanacetum coccineum]
MTLELANRSVTHPMGIAEDVVVRVDGRNPFLAPTAKALIDHNEEKLTSKNELFSGSTTNHSDALPPSSSPVKTSEILEEFTDELTLLKSNENPLFNEKDEDVENKNSNVSDSDEPVLLNTPLSDKVKCFDPKDDIDEIDAFLAMEVSSNFEEVYYHSEGDVIFLENLLSDDTTHNIAPKVISDHEPKQNESIHNTSIIFSPRIILLHHDFRRNDDPQDEDNELPNFDHQDNPSSPLPPPEPPDVCLNFKPDTAMKKDEDFNQGEIDLSLNVEDVNSFTFVIL